MSQYFAFTINNYTEEMLENAKKWIALSCEHGLMGKEKGKLNGTPHIQGCFTYISYISYT